jgi:hypothetical protein
LACQGCDQSFDSGHLCFAKVFELLDSGTCLTWSRPDVQLLVYFLLLNWLLLLQTFDQDFLCWTPYFLFLLLEAIGFKFFTLLLEAILACVYRKQLGVFKLSD